MQEKARVVAIEGDRVTVIPVDIEVCIGCSNSECKKNGNRFVALNRLRLPLQLGSEVRIKAAVKHQLIQALVSVGIPVTLAIGAYVLLPHVVRGSEEGLQVGGALLALAVGSAATYRFGRLTGNSLPHVTEIL